MRAARLLAVSLAVLAAPSPARADDAIDEKRGYVAFVARPVLVLREEERKDLGVTGDTGVVIVEVVWNGPGDKAGMRRGDMLVTYKGEAVPVATGDAKDPKTQEAWSEAFSRISHTVKPGETVEVVVERKGERLTLSPVAIDKATYEEVRAAAIAKFEAEEEERLTPKAPPLSTAGPAAAATFDFEKPIPDDRSQPEEFVAMKGVWEVREEDGAGRPNHVLLQETSVDPWAICLVAGKGLAYADGTASVRFMPLEGQEDASGGLVFRAQDRKNYYVARANALENNLRVYVLKDGVRTQLASVDVDPPAKRAWHTLSVSFVGPKLTVTLDGKASVEATDATYASGWCGLWTKADSQTQFDDLKLAPAAPK
jgi:hypothetical protein